MSGISGQGFLFFSRQKIIDANIPNLAGFENLLVYILNLSGFCTSQLLLPTFVMMSEYPLHLYKIEFPIIYEYETRETGGLRKITGYYG